jgi:putative FmdB family regulatory protein
VLIQVSFHAEVFVPTYSYECTECADRFDVVQAFTDDALTTCEKCSGRLRKLFGKVGVVFKGSGFYRTDSREAGKKATSSTNGSSSSESSSGSNESKPSSSSETSEKSDKSGSSTTPATAAASK